MDIIKIAVVCILTSVICKLLDGSSKDFSIYVRIAAGALIIAVVSIYISPVVEKINEIFNRTGIGNEYLTILFKAAGICYVSQFACDVCKDNGENLIASHAELAGKIALIVISLPLVDNLTEIIINFSGY